MEHSNKLRTRPRSSSREVRKRVPSFLWSILVGEPSPKKRVKGHLWGAWVCSHEITEWLVDVKGGPTYIKGMKLQGITLIPERLARANPSHFAWDVLRVLLH